MRRSLALFSGPETSGHTRSSTGFITTNYGSRFSLQTNLATRLKPIYYDNAMIAGHEDAAGASFRESDND
jgi:hypothetical protein